MWRVATLLMHIGALLPVARLLWRRWTDALWINPVQDITDTTGKAALVLLFCSLACTPIQRLFPFRRILLWRRPLGLYAFAYALLHLWVFTAIDYQWNFGLFLAELRFKRYIFAGLGSFLLLLPLAITSNREWMRKLGKSWKRLHRAVYLAAGLAVLHFYWLSKTKSEATLYGLGLAVLLGLRLRFSGWPKSRAPNGARAKGVEAPSPAPGP